MCHVSLAKKPAVFAACQKQHQEWQQQRQQRQQGQSDNDDEVGHVVVSFLGKEKCGSGFFKAPSTMVKRIVRRPYDGTVYNPTML